MYNLLAIAELRLGYYSLKFVMVRKRKPVASVRRCEHWSCVTNLC